MSHSPGIKSTLSVLLCAFIECYDFLVYGNFSHIFSDMFFSHISENLSLILSFMIFAIAFFVRPFGSLLFGYIGDKYGRKVSLFISATLLILSVGGVAFLPLYESIGILSPILLVLLRTLQGLSFGGEVGAIVLIAENAKKDHFIYLLSLHFAMSILGGAAGCIVFKLCYNLIPEAQFYSWGWRIPFFIGLVMAMLLPFLRRSIEESYQYLSYVSTRKFSKVPILDIILRHKKTCMIIFSLVGAANAMFYMFYAFLNIQQKVDMVTYVLLIMTMLMSGFISITLLRIYKLENVALVFQILFIIFISPIICFLGFDSILTYFILASALGIYATPVLCIVIFLFPVNIRQTGFSICYSVAVAIFGGATPAICLWLVETTKLSVSPIFYLDFCALFSIYGLFCLKKYNMSEKNYGKIVHV